MAGSIACFGAWLEGEVHRAALARTQRGIGAAASCANLTRRDADRLDKGLLWCGTIGTAGSGRQAAR